MAFGGKGKDENYYKAVPLDDDGNPAELSGKEKAKATAQVVGGAALAVAGVPMMILPGPGALTIAAGAAVALQGERKLSGREATPVEQALDAAGEKLAQTAKETADLASEKAAKKIRAASESALSEMPDAVSGAVLGAKNAALDAAERVPAAAASVAKSAQQAGSVIVEEAPKVAAAAGAVASIAGGAIAGAIAAKKASRK